MHAAPPFSIRVASGGRLVVDASPDLVGAANYTDKTNFRRLDDFEVRREGDLLFKPNAGLAQGTQAFESAGIVGMWEATRPNGDRSVVLLTQTDVYRYVYSSGTWQHVGGPYTACLDWEVHSLDGYLIFNNRTDLPFTFRVEDNATVPIYEMRDIGIASVGTICVYNAFLLCADVTEIQTDQIATFMNGGTPYGVPDPAICNRIRYKIVWSDYRAPRNWAPLLTGTIQSSDRYKVTLVYPAPFSFPVGSKLAVIGAGPSGGTLGGQVGIDDGDPVTAVSGADITLSVAADSGLVYPLTVQVSRFADISTFVGSSSIQDDSSAIILMKPLKRGLIVYRETGIFLGRYTAAVETPFVFTPEYGGRNVPAYPRAVIEVDGDYHLYPTKDHFYKFDGAGEPLIHPVMDDARPLFFNGLTPATATLAFAVGNPVTNEAWFFCPNGVLAYDRISKTCSWIDETYTAAVYVRKPGSDDFWFILARANQVLQYGATADGPITYLRLGAATTPRLKFGAVSLADDESEKDLLSYLPIFAQSASDFDARVLLSGKDNVAQAFDALLDYVLTTTVTLPLIETYYRNVYFQDEIQITDAADIPVVFVGRTFQMARVRSEGVTRNYNGHT